MVDALKVDSPTLSLEQTSRISEHALDVSLYMVRLLVPIPCTVQ